MIRVACKADLNRAVANALHPTPERGKTDGIWWWCLDEDNGHWEPADFASDPMASKLLRDRMVQRGCEWVISVAPRDMYHATIAITPGHHLHGQHHQEETAFALAALRALGVAFELVPGRDKE